MRKQKIKVNDEHPPGYDILKNVAWDLMRIFINFGLKLIKIDSKIITVSNHFRHAWWRKMTHVMIFWRKLTRNSDTKMQNLLHTVPNYHFLSKIIYHQNSDFWRKNSNMFKIEFVDKIGFFGIVCYICVCDMRQMRQYKDNGTWPKWRVSIWYAVDANWRFSWACLSAVLSTF